MNLFKGYLLFDKSLKKLFDVFIQLTLRGVSYWFLPSSNSTRVLFV